MSWFGDIFKHMDLSLFLGGSGQNIGLSASSGSRFGYNQGAMCSQFGNRGCAVQIDQNCYGRGYGYGASGYGASGYGIGSYGSSYGDEIRQAAALHRQEVALTRDAFTRGPLGGYGGYSGYGGGEGCFGRQRGGLSVDFNVGAHGGFNNYQNFGMGRGQPNVSFSLRNLKF